MAKAHNLSSPIVALSHVLSLRRDTRMIFRSKN